MSTSDDSITVTQKDSQGRLVRDQLMDYDRGRRRLPLNDRGEAGAR